MEPKIGRIEAKNRGGNDYAASNTFRKLRKAV